MKNSKHYIIGTTIMLAAGIITLTGLSSLEAKRAAKISAFVAQPVVINTGCDSSDSPIDCFCLTEQLTDIDCQVKKELEAASQYYNFEWSITDMENLYISSNLNPTRFYMESE